MDTQDRRPAVTRAAGRVLGAPTWIRPQCKRGHLYAEHGRFVPKANGGRGQWQCVACRRFKKNERTRAKYVSGFALDRGQSTRSLAAYHAWETKRQRGTDVPTAEARRASVAGRLAATHCRSGKHRWTEANTRWRHGTRRQRPCRVCRACERIREGQARWEAHVQTTMLPRALAYVAAARLAMFRAHEVMRVTGQDASYRRAVVAYQRAVKRAKGNYRPSPVPIRDVFSAKGSRVTVRRSTLTADCA